MYMKVRFCAHVKMNVYTEMKFCIHIKIDIMRVWKKYRLGEVLNLITKSTTPPKGEGFVEKGIN